MAHVRKVATGWQVRWMYTEAGKRVYGKRTFADESDAKAFRITKDAEIHHTGRAGASAAGKETVAHWAELWFSSRVDTKKPSTLASNRQVLDSTVIPLLGRRQIRSLGPADVDDFIVTVTKGGSRGRRSSKTVRHHYGVLRQVLKYAKRREAIPTNPAIGAEIPLDAHDRAPFEPVALSEEQVQDLAVAVRGQAPDTPYPLLAEFMAYLGLRTGEVSGLTVGDVLLPRGQIRVHRTLHKQACSARCEDYPRCRKPRLTKDGLPKHNRNGEVPSERRCKACRAACRDDETCCWIVSTPKNRKPRIVDITTDWLVDDLAGYLATHPSGPNGHLNPTAPLWPGRKVNDAERFQGGMGGLDWSRPWWRDGFYKRVFIPAVTDAGLPAMRLHDLRHTAGSIMLDNGMKPAEVAHQLGHSLNIFLKIYAHKISSDPTTTRAHFGTTRPSRSATATVTRLA